MACCCNRTSVGHYCHDPLAFVLSFIDAEVTLQTRPTVHKSSQLILPYIGNRGLHMEVRCGDSPVGSCGSMDEAFKKDLM